MTRGNFITFEGGEGAGKSTQVGRLVERLKPVLGDRQVVRTREPGGSKGAEVIHIFAPLRRKPPAVRTAFVSAIAKLEYNVGLLRLNLNEAAALEDFLLSSMRLWVRR